MRAPWPVSAQEDAIAVYLVVGCDRDEASEATGVSARTISRWVRAAVEAGRLPRAFALARSRRQERTKADKRLRNQATWRLAKRMVEDPVAFREEVFG